MQASLRFLILLCLSTSLASCASEPVVDPMGAGSQVAVNYTAESIQWYSIDQAGGGTVIPYGIAGGICCALYPRKWTPELRVVVKWERSDCVGQEHLCTHESIVTHKYPFKKFRKTVPIQKYTDPGEVFIVFDPNDEVRVFVSKYGVGSPSFIPSPQKPPTSRKETP